MSLSAPPRANLSLARHVGIGYFVVSSLWIFLSDDVAAMLPLSPQGHHWLQTSKGWAFVLLSTLYLCHSLGVWERRKEVVDRALRESENRFGQLAASIQEVFWLTDIDKQSMLYISPGYETVWGRTCESLRQSPQTWLEAIHPEDRPRVMAALTGQAAGTYDETYRILRPDGEIRWIRDRAFAVRDSTGGVTRVAGLARDETDRLRAEEALRETEERYRCLVELSPEGIFIQRQGVFTFANSACGHLLGEASGEDLIGRAVVDYLHPDCRESVRAKIQAINDRGESQLDPTERVFLRRDGSTLIGESLAIPYQGGALVIFRDITEKRRIASALEQQRVRLEAVVNSSSDGIISINQHDKIVLFNPAAEVMFECKAESALGRPIGEFSQPYQAEARSQRIQGKRASGDFPMEVTVTSLDLSEGRLTTLSCRDRSSVIRSEQARHELEMQLRQAQKMEAVGQLAGGVAHDFNNLLTIILGNASLMETTGEEDEVARQEILGAAQRAAELTQQLLTFSRKQVLRTQDLDLNEVVQNVTKLMRRVLGEPVALTTEYGAQTPLIHADQGMIEQVVLNLAVNARDAMPAGGCLTLSTSIEVLDQERANQMTLGVPGRFCCLAVSDTGTGIEAQSLPHIFEPFFTTKEVGRGTGLGLATVYGIVEQHSGCLQVTSEPGKGTTFRIFLPALERPAQLNVQPDKDNSLPSGSETILVVEDDRALLLLINNVLRRCGYQVLAASNGPEALRLWQGHKESIDLLLTDLIMPEGMNGLELARRCRVDRPDLKIVYSSGYSPQLADIEVAEEMRGRFLPKPYEAHQLACLLRECLG